MGLILLTIWALCGLFTLWAFLGDTRKIYGPTRLGHVAVALILALLGPFGVGVGIAALLRDKDR